jgi:hypothetical protein
MLIAHSMLKNKSGSLFKTCIIEFRITHDIQKIIYSVKLQ